MKLIYNGKKDRSFFSINSEILGRFFLFIERYGGRKTVSERGEKLYSILCVYLRYIPKLQILLGTTY